MPTISLATKDLPLPGPPAKKMALKIPGSFTPSLIVLSSITSLNFNFYSPNQHYSSLSFSY